MTSGPSEPGSPWKGPGGPVRLEVGTHPESYPCEECSSTRALLAELAAQSRDLNYAFVAPTAPGHEGEASPPPWIRLLLPGEEDGPVRFLGTPAGWNRRAFEGALEEFVRPVPLDPEWEGIVARIRRHHLVRVFTDPSARDTVPLVRHLARLSQRVFPRMSVDVVNVPSFPAWTRRLSLRWLPAVAVDDVARFYGTPEEPELRSALSEALPSGGWP